MQPQALTIETTSLSDGQLDIIYSQTLKASGGTGSYTWTITSGALPTGFTLKAKTGGISGTPGEAGKSNFTVQVSDGKETITKDLSITVISTLKPLYFNTSALEPNEVGAPYNRAIGASGGSGNYNWSISSGALPDGLKLDQTTGVISGRATKEGIFGFTINLEDGQGNSRNQSLNQQIFPAPTISPNKLDWEKEGVVGQDFFRIVSVVGGTEQINNTYSQWTITVGSLPDGLTIDSYGDISGKPQKAGTFNFTARVQDKLGGVATKELSITIKPAQ